MEYEVRRGDVERDPAGLHSDEKLIGVTLEASIWGAAAILLPLLPPSLTL